MIKVFNVKDLIKYFIKITIPLIAIFVIVKILFSINDTPVDIEYETAHLFCLDDNIPQIKNNKTIKDMKKDEMHKLLLAQELHILDGIERKRKRCRK